MTLNPLFPSDTDQPERPDQRGAISGRHDKRIEPVANPAVDLIREKLNRLYIDEPDTQTEIAEVKAEPRRSKHQQFMYELSTSGRSLAQIQTEWHDYYVNLPDHEKHEVWQEFYASSAGKSHFNQTQAPTETKTSEPAQSEHARHEEQPSTVTSDQHTNPLFGSSPQQPSVPVVSEHEIPASLQRDRRNATDIKDQLLNKINSRSRVKLQAKHHVQSLLFGLGFGTLVVVILLFSFFNEMVIAPFIQPSRHVSATPIIVSPDDVAPSKTPKVIIPKINVEIPLAGFDLIHGVTG